MPLYFLMTICWREGFRYYFSNLGSLENKAAETAIWNPNKGIGCWLICQIRHEGLQGVLLGPQGSIIGAKIALDCVGRAIVQVNRFENCLPSFNHHITHIIESFLQRFWRSSLQTFGYGS